MIRELAIQILVLLGGRYFDAISQIVRLSLRIAQRNKLIIKVPPFLAGPSIDERINKLDETRKNLLESLEVVDELKKDAHSSKQQLEEALAQLELARTEHTSKQQEIENLRQIARSDIASFRQMAGVPNMWLERLVGFVGGIVASLIASILWYFGAKLFEQ